MAKNQSNEIIRVNAVVVTVPFQFYKVGITIMDYLVITSEKIDNYIPIGFKKEDPENFFNIVNNHSNWINKTRHAIIRNVPTIKHMRGEVNNTGCSLEKLLKDIPEIENISYSPDKKQITVAISSQKMTHTTRMIERVITSSEFTYKPQLAKKFNPTGSLGSTNSGTSKYSNAMKKYQVNNLSPNSSVATSIDDSKMTKNTGWSWTTQKKIPKEIDFSDATEFPALPTTKPQTTSPTINDESITDTTVIQQAIDTALKKAHEDYRKELEAMQEAMQDKFNKQLQIIQQQNSTSTLEKKFDSLLEILMNDRSTIHSESPLRKKGKPTNLEEDVFSQRETPQQRSNTNNDNEHQKPPAQNMDVDDEPPIGPHFDVETDNRTNDSSSSEGDWITTGKKAKKHHRMTQSKLVDMMQNGGYGPTRPNNTSQEQSSNIRNTPPRQQGRQGRGSPSRFTHSPQRPNVNLTTLSSSRSGPREPHGREH